MAHAAAVIFVTMAFLATGALPEHVTSLLFFALAALLAVAPNEVIFSGFASSTVWLVFGGLIIAEAVNHTGLGKRVAALTLSRFTLTYEKLIALTVVISTAFAFVMPATLARILLLLPILNAVSEHAGLKPHGKGHNGVCLAAIMSTYQCGTAVLPANAPNLVLAGASETLYGVHFTYAEYLFVQFPVMGIVKAVVIALLTCMLFREEVAHIREKPDPKPLRAEEWRLVVVLIGSLLLWATDFLHQIQPGWIALAAGVICVLPKIGVMPLSVFNERVRFGPFIYVAAILGLGAMLSTAGIARSIGSALRAFLDLGGNADILNFLSLGLLATFTGLLTTNPLQPALLAPLAAQLAVQTGWSVKAVLMTMALGFTTMILPYQVPPVVVGIQVAGLSLRTTLRLTLPLALVSVIALLPLDYAWWRLIGYFN